jgi:hypothetical protein
VDYLRLEVKIINNPHGSNVRKGPSASTAIVSWLAYNTTVIVVAKKGDWYQLNVDGWISSSTQYVKVIKDLENKVVGKTGTVTTQKDSKIEPEIKTDPDKDAFLTSKKETAGGVTFKDVKGNTKTVSGVSGNEDIDSNSQEGFEVFEGVVPWDEGYVYNNMDIVRRNLNLTHDVGFSDIKRQLYTKFNRFKVAQPSLYAGKTFSHVFFTRPDINILAGGETDKAVPANGDVGAAKLNAEFDIDPTFYYLFNNERRLLMSLTRDLTRDHDFNVYLSNATESFELSDEFIDTQEHGETLTGYKLQYGKHNIKSNTAGTFNINYSDDRDASIYKMHKAWIEYISKVYRGEATPKREYIQKKILDYACSAYYFIVGPDGETILFWSKYFGVFPTNTPASAYSWSKGANVTIPQFNISYAYAVKEDFNPLSLAELNMNGRMDLKYLKTFEPVLATTGKAFTGAPFIETEKSAANEYIYKLRFRQE